MKDNTRFKVGKTTNPKRRLLAARTWLPHIEVIGVKPFWNISELERQLLSGLAQFWVAGEWYECSDDSCDLLFEEFSNFYDEDRDMNSVDFIYWINGSGMAELSLRTERNIRFHRGEEESLTDDDVTFKLAAQWGHFGRGIQGTDRSGREIDVQRYYDEAIGHLRQKFRTNVVMIQRHLDKFYTSISAEFESRFREKFRDSSGYGRQQDSLRSSHF